MFDHNEKYHHTLFLGIRIIIHSKLSKLMESVKNIKDWMINNFLLLNSDKTEILRIGPKKQYTESLESQFATRRMHCSFLYSQKSGCYIR